MKIKMTIIAFFASVLILSSCMKNEVSPGIENVRTAYAQLLTSQGQAAVLTAQAAKDFAAAQVVIANAQLAIAESVAAANLAEVTYLAALATAEASVLEAEALLIAAKAQAAIITAEAEAALIEAEAALLAVQASNQTIAAIAAAELVVAEAEALLIEAQAEAALTLADAEYKQAQAEKLLAEAAALLIDADAQAAATEVIRAALVQTIAMYQYALEEEALRIQELLSDYQAELDAAAVTLTAAEVVLIDSYFDSFEIALIYVHTLQKAIFDTQADILGLSLDLLNGTTLQGESLQMDLVQLNADLVTLQAAFDAAELVVGDTAAIQALELTYHNLHAKAVLDRKLKDADLEIEAANWADEDAAKTAAEVTSNTDTEVGAVTAAQIAYDNALDATDPETAQDAYLALTDPDYNYIPEWWTDLTVAITEAQAELDGNVQDTLSAYDEWLYKDSSIKAGVRDLDTIVMDYAVDTVELHEDIDANLALIVIAAADTVGRHVVIDDAEAEIIAQELIITNLGLDTLAAANADTAAQEAITANTTASAGYITSNSDLADLIAGAEAEEVALTALRADAIIDQIAAAGGLPYDDLDSLNITWLALEDIIQDYNTTLDADTVDVIGWNNQIGLNNANKIIVDAALSGLQAARLVTLATFDASVDTYFEDDDDPLAEIIDQNAIVSTALDSILTLIGEIDVLDAEINEDPNGFYAEIALIIIEIDNVDFEGRLEDIEGWELELPDLWSNYLHAMTFVDELEALVTAAEEAKEAKREEFEQYMDEFFADYLAELVAFSGLEMDTLVAAEAALVAAETLLTDSTAAYEVACLALEAAQADWLVIKAEMNVLDAEIIVYNNVKGYYGVASTNQVAFLSNFAAAISHKLDDIANTEAAIVAAIETYATGMVQVDRYNEIIAEITAKLATANEMVTFWKALLDEAIANTQN